jgi:hypothetical protein
VASVPPEHTTPGRRQGSHGYASSGGWGGGGEDGLSLEIATQWGAGGGEEEVLAGGSSPFTRPPVRAEADMVEAGTSAETAMAPAAMAEARAAEGETANGVAAVLAGGGCALVEFVGRFGCCLGDASKLGSGGICS